MFSKKKKKSAFNSYSLSSVNGIFVDYIAFPTPTACRKGSYLIVPFSPKMCQAHGSTTELYVQPWDYSIQH